MFERYEDLERLPKSGHLDGEVIMELERYMRMRHACAQFLDERPRLKKFINSLRSGELEDAYKAAFNPD